MAPDLAPEVFRFAADFLDPSVVPELEESLVNGLLPADGLRLLAFSVNQPATPFGARMRQPLLRWVGDNFAALRYHPNFLALPRTSPTLQSLAEAYLPFKADGTDNAPLCATAPTSPAEKTARISLLAWLLPALDFSCKRVRERALACGLTHAGPDVSVVGYLRTYFTLADAAPCPLQDLPALRAECARWSEDETILTAIQRGDGIYAAKDLQMAFNQVLVAQDLFLVERLLRTARYWVQWTLLAEALKSNHGSQAICDRLCTTLGLPSVQRGKQGVHPTQQSSSQAISSPPLSAERRQREYEWTMKAAYASGDLLALDNGWAGSPHASPADTVHLCDSLLRQPMVPASSLGWLVEHIDDATLDELTRARAPRLAKTLSRLPETLLSVIVRLHNSPVARQSLTGTSRGGVFIKSPPVAVERLVKNWVQVAIREANLGSIEQILVRLPEALREDVIDELGEGMQNDN